MESSLCSTSIQMRYAKITWRQKPREQSICDLEPLIISPHWRYTNDGISREDRSDHRSSKWLSFVTTVVTLLLASVFVAHLKGYGMPFVIKRPGLLRQGLVILHDKGGPFSPNRACNWFRLCDRVIVDCLPDLPPTGLDSDWPCIIGTNNIYNRLDATITVY
jgi:hypothetical protein